MLEDTELEGMQDAQEAAMKETATIVHTTVTTGNAMGITETTSTRTSKARIGASGRLPEERLIAAQLQGVLPVAPACQPGTCRGVPGAFDSDSHVSAQPGLPSVYAPVVASK